MPPRPRSEVRAHLRGLAPASFAAFVADLHRAGGTPVERVDADGPTELVVGDAPDRRRYLVHHPSLGWAPDAPPRTDVDGVVTPAADAATPPDLTVVDADALYGRLYYGIDRERCDELYETYFDAPAVVERADQGSSVLGGGLLSLDPTETSAGDTEGPNTPQGDVSESTALPDPDGVRTGRVGWAIAVVAALVVLGGALGAIAAPFDTAPVDADDPPDWDQGIPMTEETLAAAGGVEGSDPASATPAPTPGNATDGNATSFPPGVSGDGIEDASALARATGAALWNRSYRVVITYQEFVDGRSTGRTRETIWVESPSVYASEIETVGVLRKDPSAIADVPVYTNGSASYVFADGRVDRFDRSPATTVQPGDPGWVRGRLTTYVRWFLGVRESRIAEAFVRGNTTFYWLLIDGDPWPGVVNTTGSVLIDEHGLVYEIHRRYTYPDATDIRAITQVRLAAINETTVSPPEWVTVSVQENETATGTNQTSS